MHKIQQKQPNYLQCDLNFVKFQVLFHGEVRLFRLGIIYFHYNAIYILKIFFWLLQMLKKAVYNTLENRGAENFMTVIIHVA